MAKPRPQKKRVNCEVVGCKNEAKFNLHEIPQNVFSPKNWLNVCDLHERQIAFSNLKRQGFDSVTGEKLVPKVAQKEIKNGKPSTS